MSGIGFFDSGVGGLTILSEFFRSGCSLPLFYYGDNKNAPYGNRSEEEIFSFTLSGCRALMRRGVDAIVLACNTATAVCVEELRSLLPVPVIGVEPALKTAARKAKDVLLLCTKATAGSSRLERLERGLPCSLSVFTPVRLASAIESFVSGGENVRLEDHLIKRNPSAVVLGCTHYSFLREEIASFYSAPVFDGARGVYERARSLLGFSSFPAEITFLGENAAFNERAFCFLSSASRERGRILTK